MARSCLTGISSFVIGVVTILLVTVTCVVIAAPAQLQSEVIEVDPSIYAQPELVEALARHYEALGGTEPRNLDGIGGGHLLRQTRRGGLDSLSGATFGEDKRFDSLSGITFGTQKRNFDEIDRSSLNSFAKKNFDEIDRSGFDSFVKRNFDEIDRLGYRGWPKRRPIDAYLQNKQH